MQLLLATLSSKRWIVVLLQTSQPQPRLEEEGQLLHRSIVRLNALLLAFITDGGISRCRYPSVYFRPLWLADSTASLVLPVRLLGVLRLAVPSYWILPPPSSYPSTLIPHVLSQLWTRAHRTRRGTREQDAVEQGDVDRDNPWWSPRCARPTLSKADGVG